MEIIEDAAGVRGREVIPRVIPVASPAAGAEFAFAIPGGSLWYVQSVVATLTTSAAVANRSPSIAISDGSTRFARIPGGGSAAASSGWFYGWYAKYGDHFATASGITAGATFPYIPLLGGYQITSVTSALDALDQWSAIALYVLEVEETPYDVELLRDNATLRGITSNAFPQIRLGE